MTQATSLTTRWYNTPRTITPQGCDENERPYWLVEGVTIRQGDNDTLLMSSSRYDSGRSALRVEVADGELRFPLEDLVPLVLERLDIAELAKMICGNADARREILDALARRYNEAGVEDEDRRFWIAKVQAEVHDKKLDELSSAMTSIERAAAQMGYRAMDRVQYDNVLRHRVRDLMRFLGADWDTAKAIGDLMADAYPERPQALIDFRRYAESISIGVADAWNDARDYWREQVKAMFANVEVPPEPTPCPFCNGDGGWDEVRAAPGTLDGTESQHFTCQACGGNG